ncbi:MAG: hypothetical protein ACYTFG_07295 [Planctomycetota bacterium]|jgi:hypothetical protein
MTRIIFTAILALTATGTVRAADDGKRSDMVTRVYDVGFLTRTVKDHPMKSLGLLGPSDEAVEETSEEPEKGALEVETVLAMMQGMTSDWKEPASIQSSETFIVVVHTAPVQKRMEGLLESLRGKRGTTVTCTLKVYAVKGSTGLDGGGIFGEKEGKSFSAKIKANPSLALVQAWTLTGFNGQRVSAWEGQEQSYLKDYDAQVAQESAMADPVIATIREGISFTVRPTVTGPGTVLLDIRAAMAALAGAVEGHQYNAEKMGTLEKPVIRMHHFDTSLLVPDGGLAVIGSFDRASPEPSEEKGPKPEGAEKRYLVAVSVKVREAFK